MNWTIQGVEGGPLVLDHPHARMHLRDVCDALNEAVEQFVRELFVPAMETKLKPMRFIVPSGVLMRRASDGG